MATLDCSVASLRFFGPDLVPEEISRALGCLPTKSWKKGDLFNNGKPARVGSWRLRAADTEPGDVDLQVAELLGKLSSDLQLWNQLGKQFEIDIFCGWFLKGRNEGISLSVATMRALADRGIEIGFDIYAGDDGDD